jgi:hypothetical protein
LKFPKSLIGAIEESSLSCAEKSLSEVDFFGCRSDMGRYAQG